MSDCYCDFDPADFYFASHRKARKRYDCYECAGFIAPGEAYEYVFASWDGHRHEMRTCERCYDLRMWVQNSVPCFCFAHGGLDETADQAIDDAIWRAPEETVGLRFGYLRRKVMRDKFNERAR